MNTIIKILHLEDSLFDSRFIRSFIESGEFVHEYFLADNGKDFRNILETEKIDLILSDYNLPDYNGNEALKEAREKYSHIPFIFVSGAMGEDAAINAMLNGATDFVLKNKLERLVPAIKRALNEHDLEIRRKQDETGLKKQNAQIEAQNEKYVQINKELLFQNKEKEKRAAELIIANKELAFQNEEKEKRAAELIVANKELAFQNAEKEKRAAELIIAMEEIKKTKEKFRLVVESSPTAILLINDKEIITLVNHQSEKLFGYEREELEGNRFDILIPKRFLNQYDGHLNTMLKNQDAFVPGTGGDSFAINKKGTEIPVDISLNPIETIEGPMTLVSIIDLTERKIQEATLIKQLELEIKNTELEQFAYIASHDLQEPLRTVSNYMQLFEEEYSGRLDENGRKYLNSVNDATKRMGNLIKLLLDFSRLGQNSKLINVDCKKLINEVIADLGHLHKTSNANITVSEMPTLNVYETELREVFQNLIANAIKFRKKDTQPEIQIRSEKINEKWKFSVSDNGIGIDPAHFAKVFMIFSRIHTNGEGYEGNGIGLANCKKIVLLHQGEIWIESNLDQGSTFHFTIPNLSK